MKLSEKISSILEQHSGWVILGVLAITSILLIPLVAMAPEEQASVEPGGSVFDLRDTVEDRFPPQFHAPGFILESPQEDILTQEALWELYQNEEDLRRADERGELHPPDLSSQPFLYRGYFAEIERPFYGIYSLADAVQEALAAFGVSLENATDEQVKLAVHGVLRKDSPTSELREHLSEKATATEAQAEIGGQVVSYLLWRSLAITTFVAADNERLGGGSLTINVGGDETTVGKEHFNRKVQEILRGDQESFRLWGIAIDANLESKDEGRDALPYILATVLAVLVVVGISLRSIRAIFLSAVGLAILLVWLKGISNLVGLKSGLVIELIVPIAMISLGADFAIHALHRYAEERRKGLGPRPALRLGFVGVMGALVLAMLTDGVAFFSNAASGIEAVIGFGIAAGIAVVSSFVVMGMFVPLAMMRLDDRGRGAQAAQPEPASIPGGAGANPVARLRVELLVVKVAQKRALVLPLVAVITAAAVFFTLRLEAQLDVKEFFDSDSDFVVSLDKIDEHVGTTQGEPGVIYVEGDLSSPRPLAALQELEDTLKDNPYVAKGVDGELTLYAPTVFDFLGRVTTSEYARSRVQEVTGTAITDSDRDGLPDTQEQINAIYDYIVARGIPLDETGLAYDVGQVRESFFHDTTGQEPDATQIIVALPGTREQSVVPKARRALTEDLDLLRRVDTISHVGLTGSPFTRAASLDATVRSLLTSLPIAVVACFVVVAIFMRSLRYALVTIMPIGLVVAWLYAIMHLTGFHLNLVTATIGAISIGVGIDYAIHLTQRFREELTRAPERMQAMRQAARGTGSALVGSASSSIVGFSIMGFAPMPMFSAYGILTATMIFMAAAAALLVLPALLMLVTPGRGT